MQHIDNKGILIACEGGEGSGKSSVHKNLQKIFTPQNNVVFVNDPSNKIKETQIMRDLLLSPKFDLSLNTELLLYGAARAQLVDKIILPALKDNKIVISDRFNDSTLIYQGLLRNHSEEKLQILNKLFCGNLKPTLTFLFDVDPKIGLSRSNKRLDDNNIDEGRWEKMGLSTNTKINNGFLDLAQREKHRFIIIDSNNNTIEEMTNYVADVISQHILFNNKK